MDEVVVEDEIVVEDSVEEDTVDDVEAEALEPEKPARRKKVDFWHQNRRTIELDGVSYIPHKVYREYEEVVAELSERYPKVFTK